jgi:hypothetical protein
VYRALASAAPIEEPLMRQLPPMAAMPEQASLSADGLVLLKDEQVQTFCADGFLLVKPSSLSRQFHAAMVQQLDDSAERGNNIVGKAPDLMRVYTDPAILGAARSLCGPGCDVHSHRHAHLTVGSPDNVGSQQTWHKVRALIAKHHAGHLLLFCLMQRTLRIRSTMIRTFGSSTASGGSSHCTILKTPPSKSARRGSFAGATI